MTNPTGLPDVETFAIDTSLVKPAFIHVDISSPKQQFATSDEMEICLARDGSEITMTTQEFWDILREIYDRKQSGQG